MKHRLQLTVLTAIALCCSVSMQAQDWYQFHVNYSNNHWAFPYQMDHVSYFDFDGDNTLLMHRGEDEDEIITPFALGNTNVGKYDARLDSISFSSSLTTWGKNKYKCFAIYVTTTDEQPIVSKEDYVDCYISIDGMGEYPDMSGSGRIRGRGNSTWNWYNKKPYRIKFDLSSKVLGIEKNKDWVLLANYRDVTDMMNVYASITAKWMGIPFTTPIRFAELFINGEYKGVYQIAEQVEVAGHRVDIDEQKGLLLTLDVDDGPTESPNSGDNFWTTVYRMPMAVKSPKDLSSEELDSIKEEFAVLERAIQAKDYALVDSLMDIPSYIAMLQLQEYLYNVELSAPRSVFLFRDLNGKFTFGPAWDWDAGYDFNWANMTTGHTFFEDYRETIFGTDPYSRNGTYRCSEFFTNMFGNATFVRQYKEQWNAISDSLYIRNWAETQKYLDGLNELTHTVTPEGQSTYTSPQQRETERWPISGFTPNTEVKKMKTWLQNRLSYLNDIIQNYPTGDEDPIVEPTDYEDVGSIEKSVTMVYASGYSQSVKVEIDKAELAQLLGVSTATLNTRNLDLVPLDADGSEGSNTAAGTYGAWFDENGNTADYSYGNVHVFIESNDLYTWGCGLERRNCADGHTHTVRMQYRFATGTTQGKSVTVVVTFNIGENGGGEDPIDPIDPVLEGWTLAGTINKSYELTYSGGYSQNVSVEVAQDEVAALLGVDASELTANTLGLVPLNADGTEGDNTAARTYGAWFDEDGNTVTYSSGEQCVYIESNDLWTWKCGLEQSNCWDGDEYTVTMQYRYPTNDDESEGLLVNIRVTFTVSGGWGGWGW